jgi:hypothetical protein
MYTTIPHKDLVEKCEQVFNEVWEWVAISRGVDVSDQHLVSLRWSCETGVPVCEWEVARARIPCFHHSSVVHRFTKLELLKAVSWLIENTFIVNGGKCRRQRLGIPIGTNCAPNLANLYLYAYESAYIDKLVAASLQEIAAMFHMTFRFIDDVFSEDNPHWMSAISSPYEQGGIYPAALVLNDTTIDSVRVVHFLGMSIKSEVDGRLCIDVFDKRREFPFTVYRYPHRTSLIPAYIAYGVFKGLLHRYYRICTEFKRFCWNSALLARTLVQQGWSLPRLCTIFRSFLRLKKGLRWKLPLATMCNAFAKSTDGTTRLTDNQQ